MGPNDHIIGARKASAAFWDCQEAGQTDMLGILVLQDMRKLVLAQRPQVEQRGKAADFEEREVCATRD